MAKIDKHSYILCIGGANVDRKYRAKEPMQKGTSNPVISTTSVGGVARNIAENLGRLDIEVHLMTIAGVDSDWIKIKEESAQYINLEHIIQSKNNSTGSYTAILNADGEMDIAYANMDIFDQLTPDHLKEKEEIILQASYIIIDLNMPKETVEYVVALAQNKQIPIFIIPVSSPKMNRLPERLSGINWLITNRDESETYFNMKIHTLNELRDIAKRWLGEGIEHIIITNGSEGVIAGSYEDGLVYYETLEVKNIADVTGAGDAFCSGLIFGIYQNESMHKAVQYGLVNAAKTIESTRTVREDLSKENLLNNLEEMNK